MRTQNKKILLLLGMSVFVLVGLFSFSTTTFAETKYTPLAPIDGYVETMSITPTSFSDYLNNMFKLGIALCTALAVLMIIVGGIQYVSSDAWSKKSDGKERIFAALFGLLIAFGSWALLNTIDPRLLSTALTLKEVKIEGINTLGSRFAEDRVSLDSTPGTIPANDPNYTPSYNENGSMRIRSTKYYAGEKNSDPDTDAGNSITGVRLRPATETSIGVAAVDPSLIPYGSKITISTKDGPRTYIAADKGGDVIARTASGRKEPVIDFYSSSQVGSDYENVVIDYYRGGDFKNLSPAQKESFFKK